MTWRDNLRAASSEDGFIIAGGSGASMIPQNTNWHDNYMNSFTEEGIKIANLKDAVSQVETLPQEADTGSLYYLTTGANPGMYYYDGTQWVAVGGGGGTSDFNDLTNRPQLNGSAMTGNTNITSFVGTDGQTAGAQGLVPAPATTDADKFLKSDGTWATAGGGGGPTVVQTTGTSTTDVMSQQATTNMIYPFPAYKDRILIGNSQPSSSLGDSSVVIGWNTSGYGEGGTAVGCTANAYARHSSAYGYNSSAYGGNATAAGNFSSAGGNESTAIGNSASSSGAASLALGSYSTASSTGAISFPYCYDGGDAGVVNFGPFNASYGYDNTNYRLLTGVHDAVDDHDAVTLGQLNALITSLNLALGTAIPLLGNANNANNNSGSAQTVTCPFCGSDTSAESTICENCGADMTQSPYDPGEGGEEPGLEEPVDPGEEPAFPGDEPTEPTEPGDEPGPEDVEAPMEG